MALFRELRVCFIYPNFTFFSKAQLKSNCFQYNNDQPAIKKKKQNCIFLKFFHIFFLNFSLNLTVTTLSSYNCSNTGSQAVLTVKYSLGLSIYYNFVTQIHISQFFPTDLQVGEELIKLV